MKIIKVDSCRSCPKWLCHNCDKSRGDLLDFIPDDCPLEDEQDKNESNGNNE